MLPLIEIQGDYNANNYYDRLADFLEENDIKQNLRGKLRGIDIFGLTFQNGQTMLEMENLVHSD